MKNIINKKYFYLLYCVIIMLISFILWKYAGIYSYVVLMVLCSLVLIVTNDITLGLPFIMHLIFSNGNSVTTTDVSVGIYIGVGIFVIAIITYMIRNKVKFHFNKYGITFLLLGVASLIPIFWANVKDFTLYFLYFNWFLYFIVYMLFSNTIQEDITDKFSILMEELGILLALECLTMVIGFIQTGRNLDDIYSLGWGICNEAGIVMLVCLPFVFYRMYKNYKNKELIVSILAILIIGVGIWCTFSRAAKGFFLLEIGLFILCLLLYFKKYKITIGLIALGCAVILGVCVLKWDWVILKLYNLIDDNGRFDLYNKGLSTIKQSPKYIMFGAGMPFAIDFKGDIFVCHSTIYETLTVMGVFGVICLIIHFAQKYYIVIHNKGIFNKIMLVGFIAVDLYGLLDNTYHMYYYMIPLTIILTVIEKHNGRVVK